MNIYLHSLNTCGMRNARQSSYRRFWALNGHTVVADPKNADAVVVWTCGFRQDVRDNSVRQIQEWKGADKRVYVVGCLPDIDRQALDSVGEVTVIPWASDQAFMQAEFGRKNSPAIVETPEDLTVPPMYEIEEQYKAEHHSVVAPYVGRYIQLYIAEGCNWTCAYCTERHAFPKLRSYPEDVIVSAARNMAHQYPGRPIVLLADSVGDYGSDVMNGRNLPQIIRVLREAIPGVRLAIQDLSPHHFWLFYRDLTGFIREGFIAHLQIPYQSANDRVLRTMRRYYTRDDLDHVFGTLNQLGFTELDSHIIAGFGDETPEEFQQSVEFAIQHRIKYMLVNAFFNPPSLNQPSATEEEKRLRLKSAETQFRAAGIICNCNESEYAKGRFQLMKQ